MIEATASAQVTRLEVVVDWSSLLRDLHSFLGHWTRSTVAVVGIEEDAPGYRRPRASWKEAEGMSRRSVFLACVTAMALVLPTFGSARAATSRVDFGVEDGDYWDGVTWTAV
jgi:hypothetical protein